MAWKSLPVPEFVTIGQTTDSIRMRFTQGRRLLPKHLADWHEAVY
jgi:hypothetical protein